MLVDPGNLDRLRIDLMAQLRAMDGFDQRWRRREIRP